LSAQKAKYIIAQIERKFPQQWEFIQEEMKNGFGKI
jgi:hypothetical protein